jgi:hypothetical protein
MINIGGHFLASVFDWKGHTALSYNTLMAEQQAPVVFQASTNQESAPAPTATSDNQNAISWTASEFIAHSKTFGWYAILGLITIVLAGLGYYFADVVTAVVIIIVALLFGYMASRKPRELPYKIDDQGVLVDKKLYPYSGFKSFSIIQEEGIESIWLMPLQRFAPGLSIYFSPQEGQKIVNLLGNYLPFEERKLDAVDKLMHRIRF